MATSKRWLMNKKIGRCGYCDKILVKATKSENMYCDRQCFNNFRKRGKLNADQSQNS